MGFFGVFMVFYSGTENFIFVICMIVQIYFLLENKFDNIH